MKLRELTFINSDARPKVTTIHTVDASIPIIMEWYGSHHAGDRYSVRVDEEAVRKDQNGCLVGLLPGDRDA